MYFVTFEFNGQTDVGILTGNKDAVIPLAAAEVECLGSHQLPHDMLAFIEQGESALNLVQKILAEGESRCPFIPIDEVRIVAPIPRPRKNIYCIGKNYREHAFEFEKTEDESIAVPKYPVIFTKPPTTVIGPNGVIKRHSEVTQQLDYEVELAVIIGRTGSYIPLEQAMDWVFGYTIFNDVSARDLQKKHVQWVRGKGLDTFAPMGPYLVHKSVISDPDNLAISLKVNGQTRQNANTKELIFKIPELIATISAGITLEAGDIIATGTPAGVGMGFEPPRFLQEGDELELEISHLGILKNTVG